MVILVVRAGEETVPRIAVAIDAAREVSRATHPSGVGRSSQVRYAGGSPGPAYSK